MPPEVNASPTSPKRRSPPSLCHDHDGRLWPSWGRTDGSQRVPMTLTGEGASDLPPCRVGTRRGHHRQAARCGSEAPPLAGTDRVPSQPPGSVIETHVAPVAPPDRPGHPMPQRVGLTTPTQERPHGRGRPERDPATMPAWAANARRRSTSRPSRRRNQTSHHALSSSAGIPRALSVQSCLREATPIERMRSTKLRFLTVSASVVWRYCSIRRRK